MNDDINVLRTVELPTRGGTLIHEWYALVAGATSLRARITAATLTYDAEALVSVWTPLGWADVARLDPADFDGEGSSIVARAHRGDVAPRVDDAFIEACARALFRLAVEVLP